MPRFGLSEETRDIPSLEPTASRQRRYGSDTGTTTKDSARYRQLGNAVAVPVVEWIAKRLVDVDGREEMPLPASGACGGHV